MNQSIQCADVLSESRGDERDPLELRRHLLSCASCREQIGEVRVIAQLARTALLDPGSELAPDPRRIAASVVAAARAPRRPFFGVPGMALAAAAGAAVVAVLLNFLPGDAGQGRIAGGPGSPVPTRVAQPIAARPVVIEIGAPAAGRMPYVLESPAGDEHGEFDLHPGYEIETVPPDAVVVDTF